VQIKCKKILLPLLLVGVFAKTFPFLIYIVATAKIVEALVAGEEGDSQEYVFLIVFQEFPASSYFCLGYPSNADSQVIDFLDLLKRESIHQESILRLLNLQLQRQSCSML
jgi:hypothetical protein